MAEMEHQVSEADDRHRELSKTRDPFQSLRDNIEEGERMISPEDTKIRDLGQLLDVSPENKNSYIVQGELDILHTVIKEIFDEAKQIS